ncbi:hypothetical protein AB0H76_16720 [Nocardia sp. NPDC050712]|uniref:hypothetical protein n=1 Tax=Nocardia sp. NPDC050712 TaxID=3155518 RepID=UPI0033F1480B
MPSLEQRFNAFVDLLRELDGPVARAEATKLRTRLEALDFELRTTIVAGDRYDALLARRQEATRLVDALTFSDTRY